MAALSSLFSTAVTVTVLAPAYTSAYLVSKASGGEVLETEVISEWLQSAREEIDRRCGMSFIPQIKTERIDGSGSDVIFTRTYPVLEVISVTEDGVDIPLSALIVNERTGSLRLIEGVWNPGYQNIEVRFECGARTVPPLVQKIATLIAVKTALAAKNGALVDSESLGDYTQSRSFRKLNDELDRAWKALGTRFQMDIL